MSGMANKGKRMDFHTRMFMGQSGAKLDWLLENGLVWRGIKPLGWKPRPKTFSAWAYYIFVMIPRGIFK